jgi:type IV pilus assembly protein PilY1
MNTPALRKTLVTFAAGALLAGGLPLAANAAEDVDIFGGKGGDPTDPNVLIVIDSSSNWSSTLGVNFCSQVPGYTGNMADNTKFAAEVCALKTVLPLLPERMRLGIMMFAESGTNGGYVRFAVRNLTGEVTATTSTGNKGALDRMLSNWVANGSGTDNSGANQPYGKVMFEAFKYFGGGGTTKLPQGATGYGPVAFAGGQSNNSGTYRRDYDGNDSGSETAAGDNRAADRYGADANHAFPNPGSNTYTSPITSDCQKNFIIFISNGNPSTGGDGGTPNAVDLFTAIGGNNADRIKSAGAEVHASLMDEFARHFFKNDVSDRAGDQFIRTYTIAVYQPQSVSSTGVETISNTDRQMISLMKSAANAGGGKYFAATNPEAIVKALLTILNEVQAVNSVFVSASLPVSVNTQGTFLNQVYMGLFRPDPAGNPRWLGNLKQFKFIKDPSTGDIYLADQDGARAVNPATGFITPTSSSFWTAASTFWANDLKGIPPTSSDKPDGDVVEKGGTAQAQRAAIATPQAQADRITLYTCNGDCTPGALSYQFNSTNIAGGAMQTTFGVSSVDELRLLVDWIRGEDNAGGATLSPLVIGQAPCNPTVSPCTWVSGEQGPGWPTTVRASLQGDVLHSQPVVLNYVSEGPIVFYGSNDGFLRAVKGGQGTADGVELWSFIPPEFFGKFKRLRYQDPTWLNPGTPDALLGVAQTKDYFFDGPIGVWEDATTTPHTKWIFVTARRGGRMIYAFDVTIPAQPVLKWKKTQADLPRLGQTWSAPIPFKIGSGDPFLLFGAGYDPGEDSTPPVNNGVGRGIYVLNANTGATIGAPGTDNPFSDNGFMSIVSVPSGTENVSAPIASDMAFLARVVSSGFGDVYRGYVGDLDGNVYRLDMPSSDTASWRLFKFASLGTGLKFLYAPDLVKGGDRDYILIGSGDREKPLVETNQDAFFGLLDYQNNPDAVPSSVTPIDKSALTSLTGDGAMVSGPGWYRNLAIGEKVVNSPLTVAGTTFFATNKPTPTVATSCETNLGEARAYGVLFYSGGRPESRDSISTVLTGGGLAPSPKAGIVELEPGGEKVPFVIGSGKDGSRLEPERPPLNVPSTRTKVYWNVKTDG